MRSESLTSAQNPKIKELVSLYERSRLRREKGLFVVEGLREIGHCVRAGYRPRAVFAPEGVTPGDIAPGDWTGDAGWFTVTEEIFSKIAYRDAAAGAIAEFHAREHSLESLSVRKDPLILVLESVEKPGNIGAVLRTADASDADAVIICDPKCDLYNPNTIRSSIGAVFTRQVAVCSTEEAISWLKDRKIQILTAQLQDSDWYYDCDMTAGTAIVMGSEDKGLGQQWRLAADRHIRIPMLGEMDSLNVSVSAAILAFEAVRQRKTGKI